ncbi:hypothetical protein EIN_092120 [Entamoeba invadens IP1]|uniref:B box-type domain-containing protein n=1 Tax=Entamoeba invadens IP1 TaxID=370355 RepID=A0A0A1U1Z0_ENTIV|nr:hypothetical protein EIN_092120 [Entamoeba invadens IP1]ELP86647.1 hypothetical protein EIN_092120 [Entamoeba invadens IP1]|eukprot:XP_004185993.1 hypothetical protein EIN_092120 [Entamoeba invadens IP1]
MSNQSLYLYPFCRPTPLTLPKHNYNIIFEERRNEFRTQEDLRRKKMVLMLNTPVKDVSRMEKVKSGLSTAMVNILKSERCSECNKSINSNFVMTCECCDAILCQDCVRQKTHKERTFSLCKYCEFIFSTVTDEIEFKQQTKDAEENPVVIFRTQIVNTCLSFMEEYLTFQLFMDKLLSMDVPREKDVQKCEDSLKVVKAKTQKVLDLQHLVDVFDTPKKRSEATVSSNIVRSMNYFKRNILFESINKIKTFEKVLGQIDSVLDIDPEVLFMSSTMIPLKGGMLKVTLSSYRNIRIVVNGINTNFQVDGHTVLFNIPPQFRPEECVVDVKIYHKEKLVNIPGPILYFDISQKDVLVQNKKTDDVLQKVKLIDAKKEKDIIKVISTIGNKHKIQIVECVEESESEESSDSDEDEVSVFERKDQKGEQRETSHLQDPPKELIENNEKIPQTILNDMKMENTPKMTLREKVKSVLESDKNDEKQEKPQDKDICTMTPLQSKKLDVPQNTETVSTLSLAQSTPTNITTTKDQNKPLVDEKKSNMTMFRKSRVFKLAGSNGFDYCDSTTTPTEEKRRNTTFSLFDKIHKENSDDKLPKQKVAKKKIENLGELKFSVQTPSTVKIKTTEGFGEALLRIDSTVEIETITPLQYSANESGLFTITGNGFGEQPVVYIGDKQIVCYEEITPTKIVGYLPYFKLKKSLDVVVENADGVKNCKKAAITVC